MQRVFTSRDPTSPIKESAKETNAHYLILSHSIGKESLLALPKVWRMSSTRLRHPPSRILKES